MSNSETPEVQAALDAWRDQGADRVNPVRFHFIEALARRASAQTGEARRLLDEKLSALLDAYAVQVQAADATKALASDDAKSSASGCDSLADLVAYIATQRSENAQDKTASERPAYPELWATDFFRETWSKVSANQQIRQSQKHVPENAGPLNSNHLVHRSLALMGDLSPGYLRHFLSYVDGLSWMDQLTGSGAAAAKEALRAGAAKKSARSKQR